MFHRGFKLVFIVTWIVSTVTALAQPTSERGARSSQGSLTVTAVVQSSGGVIATDDGKQEVFVANAPGSPATLSRMRRLQSDAQATVAYTLPTGSLQYELTRETLLTSASSEPVIVVTVVPR